MTGEQSDKKDDAVRAEKEEQAEMDPKEIAKKFVGAVTDRETQKHFVRAGLELALGMETMLRNMPMPEGARKMADLSADYINLLIEELCRINDPEYKYQEKEGKIEKVELE
ncbi:MAG: hypothetical protein PWQ88_554 [Candidatus Methanomethylophilaceae archaeon]|nr:hypothetical protein [Candidatus Methanomethylophilaceae archaeon]MDI3541611.1 hypothetical protein [Candidatus Methanomethylophilaceae archaeon]